MFGVQLHLSWVDQLLVKQLLQTEMVNPNAFLIESTCSWNALSVKTGVSFLVSTFGIISTHDVHPRYSGITGTVVTDSIV